MRFCLKQNAVFAIFAELLSFKLADRQLSSVYISVIGEENARDGDSGCPCLGFLDGTTDVLKCSCD